MWNLGKMEGATEVSESTIPYITFSAPGTQSFSYDNYSYQVNTGVADDANKYLEYSVNGGEWKNFNYVQSVSFGGGNGDLRLRAKVDQGKYLASDAGPMFKFGNETVEVNCTGDIRTLIDYENYYCANTSKAMFMNFFNSMTNLTSAPYLPSMELASQCYYAMFKGCTGLTTAPELPATTLAVNCYYEMFYGCTGLTTAPKLPATTLATYCYREMFYGCTSLTTAPELPATTLAMGCYDKMFYDCSNLSKVTMLATKYSANWCLDNWLDNAGTSAQSRTLKLASQTVYKGLNSKGYLPTQWQSGQATIEYNNQ